MPTVHELYELWAEDAEPRSARVGPEWRERRIEDRSWSPADDLLRIARLSRRREQLEAEYGAAAVEAAAGGLAWGIYQLLGKLCPTVYVWERRA